MTLGISNYLNVPGAGVSYQYESPSQPISEAERYYDKVCYVLERKKSLKGIHITHRGDRVHIQRFSQTDGQTINLILPAEFTLMRNLYMLLALCDDETILSQLLVANFIDFSEEPSPDLFTLSSKWRS